MSGSANIDIPYEDRNCERQMDIIPYQSINAQLVNPDKLKLRLDQIFQMKDYEFKWKSGAWIISNAPELSIRDKARLQM